MSLRETCGRCAAACYERNPVIANMLGLCPLLAITDSAAAGVIFGGYFVCALWIAVIAVPPLRYLVAAPFRPLLRQLSVSVVVAAIGVALVANFYAAVAPYGVYLALVAANCLILDAVQRRSSSGPSFTATLNTLVDGMGIGASLIVFGAIREVLAHGTLLLDIADTGARAVVNLGTMPLAGSSAGALILLGLITAGFNAARSFAPAASAAQPAGAETGPVT